MIIITEAYFSIYIEYCKNVGKGRLVLCWNKCHDLFKLLLLILQFPFHGLSRLLYCSLSFLASVFPPRVISFKTAQEAVVFLLALFEFPRSSGSEQQFCLSLSYENSVRNCSPQESNRQSLHLTYSLPRCLSLMDLFIFTLSIHLSINLCKYVNQQMK